MKYKYLYQTRDNENREDWIRAKNRAEAYSLLRKNGIRPYRVIGDDPVEWMPWAVGAVFAAMLCAIVVLASGKRGGGGHGPLRRQQIEGDRAEISEGVVTCWSRVLSTPLDRYLSAYAQPGYLAIPPEKGEDFEEEFRADLDVPLEIFEGDSEAAAAVKRIVLSMRGELSSYLDRGGTVREYLDFLDERQDEEIGFVRKARESVESAVPASRERLRENLNIRLREMGLAEI